MTKKALAREASRAKPPAPRQVEGENGSRFSFGLVFDINGQAVPISSDDIGTIKEKGAKFELPSQVVLGSFSNLIDWLLKTFGVTVPTKTGLVWFDQIIDQIINMQFTVIAFKLEVPGSESEEKTTRYALQLSGEFQGEPLKIIPGFSMLGIRGGVFGATNIPPAIHS